MTCYHPVKAYRTNTVGKDGKRGITFKRDEAFLDLEVELKCGRCMGCRIEYVQHWTTRLVNESHLHNLKSFATLTYSPEHVPANGTLVKRDFQLFMKKLRKAHGGRIRFFACGEYGEGGQRPHYHAILYGVHFADRRKHSERDGVTLYVSETLNNLWGKGFCTIGDVTDASCGYVAGYVTKKITGEQAKSHYSRLDPATGEIYQVQPEFVLMSRRPGIGSGWYDTYKSDLYPSDFTVRKGRKVPVPKYYDRLLKEENPTLLDEIKERRLARMRSRKKDNTPRRLADKETVAKARHALKTRTL